MTEMAPTDCPYYLISRASYILTARLKAELARAGLERMRPAYLGVLWNLWIEDGLKMVELGRRSGLEPSSMTGLLDRMERDGLLERRDDDQDRRIQNIFLTPEGMAIKDSAQAVVNDAIMCLFDGIPEAELESLKDTLRRLLARTK